MRHREGEAGARNFEANGRGGPTDEVEWDGTVVAGERVFGAIKFARQVILVADIGTCLLIKCTTRMVLYILQKQILGLGGFFGSWLFGGSGLGSGFCSWFASFGGWLDAVSLSELGQGSFAAAGGVSFQEILLTALSYSD